MLLSVSKFVDIGDKDTNFFPMPQKFAPDSFGWWRNLLQNVVLFASKRLPTDVFCMRVRFFRMKTEVL